jgi:uncharacterized HAD superfamily protein
MGEIFHKMRKCIIFDIDGTIADLTHRRHFVATKPKNWPAFAAAIMDDTPIEQIIDVLRMYHARGDAIILCSGREATSRDKTVDWLAKHNIPFNNLYMRPAKDYRPDDIVKEELLDQILADGYSPYMVYDDRDRLIKMWRRRGYVCAQVAEGNF